MGKSKTKDELIRHKQSALNKLDRYLNSLISAEEEELHGNADKLSYWLKDWSTFLEFETNFSPMSLRRYKRGEIIKVHLGFNVGSEEGGLHYAVVLDNENAKSSPIVTVIPLTSVKSTAQLSKLKNGSIFLGNELYTNLSSKRKTLRDKLINEIDALTEITKSPLVRISIEEGQRIEQKIKIANKELDLLNRMDNEIIKMRKGSIALVSQITTISKIRIYDPKTDHDILSGIRLTNESLDKIDSAIVKKFTKR